MVSQTPRMSFNMLLKSLKFLGLFIAGLVGIIVIRAWFYQPELQLTPQSATPINFDVNKSAQHLSKAIQIKTISYDDANKLDKQAFGQFIHFIKQTYPNVFSNLQPHYLNDYTVLLRWPGKNQTAPAVLFSAHYDVVPVIPNTEDQWQHPPFAGVIDDQYIWGRGALDDKSAVIALLESANALINNKFAPQSDIYFAFTHDEEIGSEFGAKAVVNWMQQNNVTLAWSLDEGSFVLDGLVPGVEKPIASINVAEKGYLTVNITANSAGGHSSMPPQETAVSILAQAILKLRDNPVPGGLTDVSAELYDNLGRNMSFGYRLLFANTWLFKPVIENVMGGIPSGNAMLRTTTAPTMLSGSVKSNVLPINATATVNFRIHPRDTSKSVLEWVESVINDERVSVEAVDIFEPSHVASTNNGVLQQIAQQAVNSHGDIITAPGLTIAATDSRFYDDITDAYRFNPMKITNEDLDGFHGTNERISIENLEKAIHFYIGLIQQQ